MRAPIVLPTLAILLALRSAAAVPPAVTPATAPAGAAFEFRDGDRVALIGNTFFEREQTYSHLEALLKTRFADRTLGFRNLGWSGDTVFGTARAYFDEPNRGFERLRRHVAEVKPTVLFVCYGMGESFDGPAGLDGFVKGYNRLVDMLKTQSAENARLVLISPIRHERLGDPYPDPSRHNEHLRLYADAIAKLAAERGARFVNLFDALIPSAAAGDPSQFRFTENGIHLSPPGYYRAALEIERQLGYGPRGWAVAADAAAGQASATGGDVKRAPASPPAAFAFTFAPKMLPGAVADLTGDPYTRRVVKITGLPPGTYALMAGETRVAKGQVEAWSNGIELASADDPAVKRVDRLRELLVAKNVQYFNKYRPANETYIFLFRKGEQGRNAVEIPQFDVPIAALEAEIAKLRTPEAITYTLLKE